MKMLIGKTLIGLVFTLFVQAALAQSVELHVRQGGSQQTVDDEHVAAQLTAFVESATVDSTGYLRPDQRWQQALASPVSIHAVFDPPREMRVWSPRDKDAAGLATVREIVVVLSGNDGAGHILVRTPNEFRSVTKYAPCAMEKLITAARLDTVLGLNTLREYCRQTRPQARTS